MNGHRKVRGGDHYVRPETMAQVGTPHSHGFWEEDYPGVGIPIGVRVLRPHFLPNLITRISHR